MTLARGSRPSSGPTSGASGLFALQGPRSRRERPQRRDIVLGGVDLQIAHWLFLKTEIDRVTAGADTHFKGQAYTEFKGFDLLRFWWGAPERRREEPPFV